MSTINTKSLSGFAEYLPEAQLEFDRMRDTVHSIYALHGFTSLDLPLIYRSEVLLAKAGGETEKQIYTLQRGDNELALRFDLTVPLARYVAENQGQLNFPLKIAQITKAYRGERAQHGRFREFYQCDADIIGRGELDLAYDAEIIGLIIATYSELNLGNFTVHVSNRKILSGLIVSLGLGSKTAEILRAVDRIKKVSIGEFKAELEQLGLNGEQVLELTELVNITGTNTEILDTLRKLPSQSEQLAEGIDELARVIETLELQKKTSNIQVDLQIARGLDYYTGTVFETILEDLPELGSVAGGGRYDNLAGNFSKDKYPGVGMSIGLTRLFAGLQKAGKLNQAASTRTEALILPIDQSRQQLEFCFNLADTLRGANKSVDILLQDMPIKKKLKYADKIGVANVVVVGDDEVSSGRTLVKNMKTGEVANLDEFIRE